MNLSLLVKGNPRDFSESISEIKHAHDEIMNIRQLIWEEEATSNLKIKFEKLGLDFDNKMTNKELLQQMNELDSNLMMTREYVRAKNNVGIGYFNENTKYENGLTSELLKNMRDKINLSLLSGDKSNNAMSMSDEYIEQAHNEIMNLRQLIWLQADRELRDKLDIDGIELDHRKSRTDYFEKLDELDLKLMEIKTLKRTKERIADESSIYKHGMKAFVSNAITNGIGTLQVQEADNMENAKIQDKSIEGVTKDD